MTNRPWMPLYVADYLADTMHLSAAQSGAYLHLIMHYWQHESLPAEDEKLARIARMRIEDWRRHRGTVEAFFQPGWRHARIDRELSRSAEISNKRKDAALQKHSKTPANAPANAEQLHPQLQPQSHISEPDGSAPTQADLERELFRRGKQVCGKASGGLIASLLKSRQHDVALARSVVELAATKHDPREFVAAATRSKTNGNFGIGSEIRGSDAGNRARELAQLAREREAEAGIYRPSRVVGSD